MIDTYPGIQLPSMAQQLADLHRARESPLNNGSPLAIQGAFNRQLIADRLRKKPRTSQAIADEVGMSNACALTHLNALLKEDPPRAAVDRTHRPYAWMLPK